MSNITLDKLVEIEYNSTIAVRNYLAEMENKLTFEDLVYMLSEVPAEKREGFLDHIGQKMSGIMAFHVTTKESAAKIRKEGLNARRSKQSYDRPEAVYFFLDPSEINEDNKAILLEDPSNSEIISVAIPKKEFLEKTVWDGLYNVSFNKSRTAIQFAGNVPADWIK